MKILIIYQRLPLPLTTSALTYRVLNAVKYLSKKYGHNITIVGFKYKEEPEEYLKKYCDKIMTVTLPTSVKKRMVYYFLNYIIGIFLGYVSRKNIFDFRFSWKLQKIIRKLFETKEFDVVFVDVPPMVPYISTIKIPKVAEVWDIPRVHKDKLERSFYQKIYQLLCYLIAKDHEKMFEKFDACITLTEQERDSLTSSIPNLNISVIPFGVDTDSKFEDFEEDFPSLLFLGILSSLYNQRSILFFYKEIYPIIKEKIPNIKLYIVGKAPSKEILKLAMDNSVIVTGYVEDVRPYLARASVISLPVHGYGIKTRILEAMAMGKPVVTSSEGVHGIDVTPEENIIIAEDPEEFARRIIELLNDEQLREKIGVNARKLMEEKYSWEKMTDMLNEVFQKVVNK